MPVFNDKNSYNKWIKRITVLYCTVLRFTKSQMKTKRNEPIAQKIEYLIPNTKAPKAKNVNKFCFHHQFYIFYRAICHRYFDVTLPNPLSLSLSLSLS
jgi:hypothetical protein